MRGEARRELSTSGDMMGSDRPGLVLKVPCPGQALSPRDTRTVGHSFHGHVRTLESLVLECVPSLSPRGTPGGEQMILCPFITDGKVLSTGGKQCTQGNTAGRWQGWDSNPGLVILTAESGSSFASPCVFLSV